MNTSIPATQEGGTSNEATGQGNDGRGLHNDGSSFWNSNSEFLQSIASRYRSGGGGQPAPQQAQQAPAGQSDDYQEYIRWKAAREGKDPRAVLALAGMQPRDVLDATLFGGPTPTPTPPPDPVETIRAELNQLKEAMEAERKDRQTTAEKISESKAKSAFQEQIKSMNDLILVQKWGDEAIDTAWNVYIAEVDAAFKARDEGKQVQIPSLRAAAIQVENYLRQQAGRMREVIGGSGAAPLEQLPFYSPNEAPSQAASNPAQVMQQAGTSPTLRNVSGHAGAPQTTGAPTDRETLRQRALEAAKRFRK